MVRDRGQNNQRCYAIEHLNKQTQLKWNLNAIALSSLVESSKTWAEEEACQFSFGTAEKLSQRSLKRTDSSKKFGMKMGSKVLAVKIGFRKKEDWHVTSKRDPKL